MSLNGHFGGKIQPASHKALIRMETVHQKGQESRPLGSVTRLQRKSNLTVLDPPPNHIATEMASYGHWDNDKYF